MLKKHFYFHLQCFKKWHLKFLEVAILNETAGGKFEESPFDLEDDTG
jgi:hypothetical protein